MTTWIDDYAFAGCTSLVIIEVDENNKNYKSIDGNLYSKNGASLLRYAIGKKDVSFTIPDHVTRIYKLAFGDCTSLISVVIPTSVKTIDMWAFGNCTSLTNIYFEGTVEQWEAVDKDYGWDQNTPAKEVICSNGTVSLK